MISLPELFPRGAALLALAALAALTGCALRPPPAPPAPPRIITVPVVSVDPGDAAMREFLAYSERLAHMDTNARTPEEARLLAAARTPDNTLELALLLGQSDNVADLNRALTLLDGINRSSAPEDRAWQPLSHMLTGLYRPMLATRQKLHEQIEHQAQQLREAQGRSDQLSDRNSQLSQKLDALKAIELSLPSRSAASSSGTPATGVVP